MRKISTLLFLAVLLFNGLQAQYRDINEAQELALSFLSKSADPRQRAPMNKDVLVPVSYAADTE